MLIRASESLLLIVDAQERLAPAVAESPSVIARIGLLLRAARLFDVPVLATEHYSAGIGGTVEPLAALLRDGERFEKIHFSAPAEPGFLDTIAATGRRRIVACGMETHVCVLQTVLGLRQAGFDCCLAADAAGSRRETDRALGIERMRGHGVEIVTSEMVVFEWLHRAGTPVFKEALKLIR